MTYKEFYTEMYKQGRDVSLIAYPPNYYVGAKAFHQKSSREVILTKRELGDGWIVKPANGDKDFYEHSEFLEIIP